MTTTQVNNVAVCQFQVIYYVYAMFGYYMLGYYIKAQGQFSQLFGATGHISHYKNRTAHHQTKFHKKHVDHFPRAPGLCGHRKTGGRADVHTDACTFCLMTKLTSVESKWIPVDWQVWKV